MRTLFVGLALLSASLPLSAAPAASKVIMNTIGPTAALTGNGHAAQGTVLLACTPGEQVQFTLTLSQNGASGTGHRAGVCKGEGEVAAYPVAVPAGQGVFGKWIATACATAVDRSQGDVVETREWCRAGGVSLSFQ